MAAERRAERDATGWGSAAVPSGDRTALLSSMPRTLAQMGAPAQLPCAEPPRAQPPRAQPPAAAYDAGEVSV